MSRKKIFLYKKKLDTNVIKPMLLIWIARPILMQINTLQLNLKPI